MVMAYESALLEMRPRLRNDAVFLRVETGVYLRHSDSACVLKGQLAYEWMSTLGPRLNGESTVNELCAGLDESQRQTVIGLTRALLARGFLRDVPPAEEAGLTEAEIVRFQPQINFIEHFTGTAPEPPATRFVRFRTGRVLVMGSAEMLIPTVAGLLRNGMASVAYVAASGTGDVEQALSAEVAQLRGAGVPVVLTPLAALPTTAWHDYDVVVFAAEGPGLGELLDLSRLLAGGGQQAPAGPLLLPIVLAGGRAVIGPWSGTTTGPCWICGQLRLGVSGEPAVSADIWREIALGRAVARGGNPSGTVPSMIGNAAALEVFRLLTGQIAAGDQAYLVVQNVETLESAREWLLPHPACPVCPGGSPTTGTRLPAGATDEEIYEQTMPLLSALLGPLYGWADEPAGQIPLKIGSVRVAAAGALAGGVRTITAFHLETILQARGAAQRAALSWYAGTATARADRVGGTAQELTAAGRRVVTGAELITWSGLPGDPGARTTWVPAVSLVSGAACLVPAAAAYPLSDLNRDFQFERTPAGAAAGRSTAELIESGLSTALAYHALAGAVRTGGPVGEVPEQVLLADEEAAFALKSLRHLGRGVQVYPLPGAAPAHAVLAVLDGGPLWTVGAGLSARDALRTALRDALGLAQTQHNEGTAADLGDPLLADFDPRTGRIGGDLEGWAPTADLITVAEVLSRVDDAYLVDTTPADLRAVGAIITGTVLLAAPRGESR
jgi:bacteriocin biosynthesis cyclodehydratase domain-containing protein